MHEQGNISITAENMFPIIRKWLYSEKDIFIRELVSNGADAIAKLDRLQAVGKAAGVSTDEAYKIVVTVNEDDKQLQFTDNGIGMTGEEVQKYINQVAFSGAKDFFEQYKDTGAEGKIIGHFGLGFYSCFMASAKVTIDTLSFQEGAEAVRWESESGVSYEISPSDRTERGTTITLQLDEESDEYANLFKIREVLNKYFRYLPTPIYLRKAGEEVKEDEKPINENEPLWVKDPKECTDEEYKSFYHQVFTGFEDPLFWVHLNIDYPFRLKGILYFPKLRNEFDTIEGQVKLYCNRVFVADNLKEVIPEYLLLLKGCIDCPDLPLNVSRSMLQNDATVQKISGYITRKVADRINAQFKDERDVFEKNWDEISPFIKYGCLRDEKFYDRVKNALIFKDLDGGYKTVEEYLEAVKPTVVQHEVEEAAPKENGEEMEKEPETERVVYYVTDPRQQAQYVKMFRENGLTAVVLDHVLDNHFITLLERKNDHVRFARIDADLSEVTSKEAHTLNEDAAKALFTPLAGEKTPVEMQVLMNGAAPAVLVLTEESRRMQEMARMFGQQGFNFPEELKLVLNAGHPLVKTLVHLEEEGKHEDASLIAAQVYDLARLAQKPLSAEDMTAFMERSAKICAMAAEK